MAADASETQVLMLHSITSQMTVVFIVTAMKTLSFVFKIFFEKKGCTHVSYDIAEVTKFCRVVPDICGDSIWNLLHVTLLVPRILRWPIDVLKISTLLF